MKPHDDQAGRRLWAIVTATVRPLPGRTAKPPPQVALAAEATGLERVKAPPAPPPAAAAHRPPPHRPHPTRPPAALEPGRHKRVVKGREPLAGVIDLHGMTYDQARAGLTAYVMAAHAAGRRTVLVITGKGALGDGVLRRDAPEWLAQPPLRPLIAGISEAHRRHGGEGALYVALKRKR